LLAHQLNVPDEFITNSQLGVSFPYRGIRVIFSRSPSLDKIEEKMGESGLDVGNPMARDICNKDFTINMLVYNVLKGSVSDYVGAESDVKGKVVKTLFDPDFVIQENPMVILRAIALKMDGFELDEDLERAIIENSSMLQKNKYSPERMAFAREYLRSKGINKFEELAREYGLADILLN
jgi:tRNA nucleotidyltransferase/poly(A) polymerase